MGFLGLYLYTHSMKGTSAVLMSPADRCVFKYQNQTLGKVTYNYLYAIIGL